MLLFLVLVATSYPRLLKQNMQPNKLTCNELSFQCLGVKTRVNQARG